MSHQWFIEETCQMQKFVLLLCCNFGTEHSYECKMYLKSKSGLISTASCNIRFLQNINFNVCPLLTAHATEF